MITVEKLIAAGGKEWRKDDMHRVYFNDLAQRVGLEYETYKTGNVKWAKINGTYTSNSHARGIINQLSFGKFWYDVTAGEFRSSSIDEKYVDTITQSIMAQIERQYFALVDREAGVLAVGATEKRAIESYAAYCMAEQEYSGTHEEQVSFIKKCVEENPYQHVEECTRALYLNFIKEGNQAAYTYDSEGLLDLQPDSEA
jgi:hypothetical protein